MSTEDTAMLIRSAIGLTAATVAYVWAHSYEQRFGVRPMRTRPWGWALFCFFFIPVGVLALLFTEGNAHRKRPTAPPATLPESTPLPHAPSTQAPPAQAPDFWHTPSTPAPRPPATSGGRSAIPGQTIVPGNTTGP